jgi:hypothetical protein
MQKVDPCSCNWRKKQTIGREQQENLRQQQKICPRGTVFQYLAESVQPGIDLGSAGWQHMLALIGTAQSVKKVAARMSGLFDLSGFCYSSGAPLSANSLGLFDD